MPVTIEKYLLGNAPDTILISAQIGTMAFAQTSINLAQPNGTISQVAHSPAQNGNVQPPRVIGTSLTLVDSLVSFLTQVNFSAYSDAEKESAIENIVVEYFIEGGYQGKQLYLPTRVHRIGNIVEYSTLVLLTNN